MREPLIFATVGMLFLSAAAAPTVADAEDADSAAASAAAGTPVIVSATRVPTPASDVASSATVITADQIALQDQRTLADVLRDVAGLNLVQSGGAGAQASLFMRGTNSNHTKVLVDGIDVSDPSSSGATFDFGQFQTQDIEKIEILRGPQSGLYGSDAIGGVISITTKNGSGEPHFSGDVEGGSFDTFNQAGSLRGAQGPFAFSANVDHLHSGSTPVTPLDLLTPGELRNDDYYDNLTASTKLGFAVANGFDLGLVGRYTDTHLRITGDDFSTFPSHPAAERSESDTSQYYARATAHLDTLDGLLDQTLGVAYTRDRTANLTPDSPESLDTGARTKIDWLGVIKASAEQSVVVGAEHARDSISEPLSADTSTTSGFAELQSRLGDSFHSALNVRYDDNDRFGSKVTYRFAPTYQLEASGTKLKASLGTGFKAPTLAELFQSFPAFFFFANPDLKPETSVGYDLGVEQSVPHGSVGVTYFHNRIRNLITTDETGTTYANVGRAVTDGVESFVAYQILNVSLRADYTYTQATDTVLNQELLRRPKHKGSLNATWRQSDAFSVSATVLTVSSWIDGNRDFSIPRLRAPGYTVLNVAASYDLTRHLSLFGRLDNLLDRQYQNPTGFLQPRIGAFAGVRIRE